MWTKHLFVGFTILMVAAVLPGATIVRAEGPRPRSSAEARVWTARGGDARDPRPTDPDTEFWARTQALRLGKERFSPRRASVSVPDAKAAPGVVVFLDPLGLWGVTWSGDAGQGMTMCASGEYPRVRSRLGKVQLRQLDPLPALLKDTDAPDHCVEIRLLSARGKLMLRVPYGPVAIRSAGEPIDFRLGPGKLRRSEVQFDIPGGSKR